MFVFNSETIIHELYHLNLNNVKIVNMSNVDLLTWFVT